jgi:hypothetical protein
MNFKYRILDVAANEILEAAIWYDDKRKGLGDDLIFCFESQLNYLLNNPEHFQIRHKHLRLVNIKRFPYQIVYYLEKDLITIVAFFHAKRNPKQWKKRK